MDKDKFHLQGKTLKTEMFRNERGVRFEWNMLYQCNYRCPHCFFEGKWEEYGKRTVFMNVARWMEIWENIEKRYGRCSLVITGGEPFIYPGFVELMKELSAIHYPIGISTNASVKLEEFVNAVDPERVSVSLSFHPEYAVIEEILRKQKFMEEHGFRSEFVNLCVYPPYVPFIETYVKKACDAGITMKLIPFVGEYGGKRYPEGYSNEEKTLLGIDSTWHENVFRKGTLCAAGQRSALLFPDGKVARCGQIGERHLLGNVFSGGFELLQRPLPCDAELCPCLETVTVEDEE